MKCVQQCCTCGKLEADFILQHGEILDVPPAETSSPRPLSHPYAKPLSNDQTITDTAIFCSSCLKNQHILTETLANYLPSPDDPTYDQYEASYPEWRRNLEERHPPVCARCEPRARRQIQEAAYTAKSDHLRRMMERSRARKVASWWGWRSLVVTLGELLFWISILGQLIWDIISVLEDSHQSSPLGTTSMSLQPMPCTTQVFTKGKTESGCSVTFVPIASTALLCGFLSSWWNPKWQHRLQGREGRLMGLRKYYQINVAVLIARSGFLAWTLQSITDTPTASAEKVAHTLTMILTLVLTSYSISIVTIDKTPLVSWQNSPAPLLSQQQYNPPASSDKIHAHSLLNGSRSVASKNQSFPIGSLVQEPRHDIWQPPTPSLDADQDAMEWESSQDFRPNPRLPKFNGPSGPSPFHGALPAKPTNRLLYPQLERKAPQREAIGLPPGFFDKRDRLKTGQEAASLPPMAQPKFFSQRDLIADTGLESIFDAVFSLRDGPALPAPSDEGKAPGKQDQHGQNNLDISRESLDRPQNSLRRLNFVHASKFCIFVVGLLIFYAAQELQLHMPHLKLLIIGSAGTASLMTVFSEFMKIKCMPDVSDLVWSGLMSFAAAFLVSQKWIYGDEKGDLMSDRTRMVFLVLCSCWELPRIFDWQGHRPSECAAQSHPQTNYIGDAPGNPSLASQASHNQSQNLSPSTEAWQPVSIAPQMPGPTWQTPERSPHYRLRSDSTGSTASCSSISTAATTTTAGWKSPNFQAQQFNQSSASGRSPGFSLGSLPIDGTELATRSWVGNGTGTRNRRRGA